jgi:hypothetical protein
MCSFNIGVISHEKTNGCLPMSGPPVVDHGHHFSSGVPQASEAYHLEAKTAVAYIFDCVLMYVVRKPDVPQRYRARNPT